MNRVETLIIALSLLFSTTIVAIPVSPVKANPTTTVYLDLSTTAPEVGQTFDVTIIVSDVEGLWAWQAGIQWDPTVLEYVSYAWGDSQSLQAKAMLLDMFRQ